MSDEARAEPLYVCGHSARELDRLEAQSALFRDITRDVFVEAGIGSGMRVLDIGCGAGDVSFLAHELVGPAGSVVGIDRAPEALVVARRRADERGFEGIAFVTGDVTEQGASGPALAEPFDAVVGRFVLMHQANPTATLRAAAARVRAGGVVAMIESHMDLSVAPVHSFPHSPTYGRVLEWMTATIRAAGGHADMGLRLRATFVDAGLPEPVMRMHAKAEGGPDAPIHRYTTESLRSMLPLAKRFGIVDLAEEQLLDLEDELRSEVAISGGVLVSPVVVGASARCCTAISPPKARNAPRSR